MGQQLNPLIGSNGVGPTKFITPIESEPIDELPDPQSYLKQEQVQGQMQLKMSEPINEPGNLSLANPS